MKFISFLMLALVVIFFGCKKGLDQFDAASTTSFRTYQPSELQNQFADVLRVDLTENGFLKTRIKQLFQRTKTGEFMLAEILDGVITPQRTEVSLPDLLQGNPLIEVGFPTYDFQNALTFEQFLDNIEFYVLLPDDFEESLYDSLFAITPVGDVVKISANFDETIKYAVVRNDEAEDARVGTNLSTYLGQNIPDALVNYDPIRIVNGIKYHYVSDIMNAHNDDLRGYSFFTPGPGGPIGGGTGGGGTTGGGTEECDRPVALKEHWRKYLFSSKNVVQQFETGFHMPKVEVRVVWAIPEVTGNVFTSENKIEHTAVFHWKSFVPNNGNGISGTPTQADWDSVSDIDWAITYWSTNIHSIEWKTTSIEMDYSGQWGELSVGVAPTFKVDGTPITNLTTPVTLGKVPLQSKDKKIGEALIHFCDPALGEGSKYKHFTFTNGGAWMRQNVQTL
jgi:hypothetical protein